MSDIDDLIDRLTERQQREFALACARRVQHLMTDPRSIAALDTRERWLRGEATDEEMAATSDAARAAAWAATSDEAWAAGWAAAATSDAARAAAWAATATSDAARAAAAAPDAAWAAERAWQREELERMLRGGA